MFQSLKGKSALVTGGTRGIGAAIAARFQSEGASVTVTGTKANGHGPPECNYLHVDFSNKNELETFARQVQNSNFEILVNNSGINKIASFEKIDPEDFDLIHTVNVRAPFLLCKAVIPGMKKMGWGRIVNISSIFGKITKELRASYSASKFALDGLTASLAVEVAPFGILANCVAPGFIDTELTRGILGEKGIEELVAKVPMKRLGKPEEVAAFVSWLAGPENTFITGQNLAIDGGFTRV